MSPSPATEPRASRAPALALLAVVAGLLLTAQERTLGSVTDEQQLLGTAVALVEAGDLGLPRGHGFSVPRPQGDALAPYGMGTPLAFVPAVAAAERWERTFGGGTSQSLLVLVPLALIAAAAWLAGVLAAALGASPLGRALAIVGTGLASPLWPLGSTAFSEPLLAAALVGAAALAASAARLAEAGRSPGAAARAALAGALAGLGVLTKSLVLAVAPWCLLPLLTAAVTARRRLGLLAWAALGAAPLLATWLAFEVARFGRPLASYGGQPFSHSPLEGWWQLTVGPNEGLFLYFPLALLALPCLASRDALRRGGLAVLVPAVALVSIVSAWWAWDGSAGWGPRLVAPVVPLLAGAAGAWASRARRWMGIGATTLAAGFLVNLLGLLQPDVSVLAYVNSCGPVKVPEDEVARWPSGLAEQFPPGQRRISRSMATVDDPAFSAPLVHAKIVALRLLTSGDEAARREALVARAPWRRRHPDLAPNPSGLQGALSGVLYNALVDPFTWPHWGASLVADAGTRRTRFIPAWQDAVEDQALRALDVGDARLAAVLATTLFDVAPRDRQAALLAECLRAAGRDRDLDALLAALPARLLETPEVQATLALRARDAGDPAAARRHLEAAAAAGPAGLVQDLARDPAGWPATTRPWFESAAPRHPRRFEGAEPAPGMR